MPKRAARARRLRSSESRVVVGRLADRVGLGAGVSVGAASSFAVVEVEGLVVVVMLVVSEGGSTVRSEVLEGSVEGIWLGTAVGLAGWARPPAAIVAAEAGSVAAAASSSQSISSSPAVVAAAVAVVVVVVLGLEEAAAWSASDCWRRAMSSAFLPVCGRERDLRRSSSSAFFFLV